MSEGARRSLSSAILNVTEEQAVDTTMPVLGEQCLTIPADGAGTRLETFRGVESSTGGRIVQGGGRRAEASPRVVPRPGPGYFPGRVV